jgi:hypothetical protein
MEETDARPKKRGFLFAVIRFLRLRVVASVLAIVEIDGKQKMCPRSPRPSRCRTFVSLPNEPVDPRTRKTTCPPGVFSLALWENWRALKLILPRDRNNSVEVNMRDTKERLSVLWIFALLLAREIHSSLSPHGL